MKRMLLLLICLCFPAYAGVEKIAPQVPELSSKEISRWVGKVHPEVKIDNSIIRRGLVSGQTALRADCARYLASHGTMEDVPYLVDALSDETMHVGATYPYAGMTMTRYWANVALVCITKIDVGFRWDDPVDKRQQAIDLWRIYWENEQARLKHASKNPQMEKRKPYILQGKVTDKAGNPLKGVRVEATHAETGLDIAETYSDSEGEYKLEIVLTPNQTFDTAFFPVTLWAVLAGYKPTDSIRGFYYLKNTGETFEPTVRPGSNYPVAALYPGEAKILSIVMVETTL